MVLYYGGRKRRCRKPLNPSELEGSCRETKEDGWGGEGKPRQALLLGEVSSLQSGLGWPEQVCVYFSEGVSPRDLGVRDGNSSWERRICRERGQEMMTRRPAQTRPGRSPSSQPGDAFLRQDHLNGSELVPSWCYACVNPKLSLKICSTQSISDIWGKE